MPAVATAAVGVALALDLALAEPPERLHPVAWYGRALGVAERPLPDSRLAGALLAAVLPLAAAAVAGGIVAVVAARSTPAAALAAGLVVFSTTSLRMLLGAARDAVTASEADLDAARDSLRALVGRDPGALSAAQVRSAAAESAAENLSDGLVAPLLGFALLAPWSLPGAAAAVAWIKAVNTGDSMLGYPGEFGWASARLDDAVMWVPARASAPLLALAAADPGALSRARRWARAPASPNAGWPMATLAAVLDARLEKPGAYALGPDRPLPDAETARRAIRIVRRAGGLAFLGAGVIAWA